MKFLQNIKVSTNLWLILIVAAIGLIFVSGVSLFSLRQALSQERHEKIKQLVDVPYGILTFFQAQEGSGKLTKEQAQAQAIAAIKALRYDKDGYFWINDFHPNIVMHPIKPELDGKDVSGLKDPAGTFLFVEFAKVAQKSGEGFVPYLWPKPGSQTPVEKISYVKGFQPWGWVIGSGVYIDDLDAVFWRKAAASLTTIVIGVAVLLIMAVATMRAVLGKLGGEPDYAASVVREISGGNLSVNVKIQPGDSTSLLAGMKSMRDRLNQTMVEVRASIDELAQWSTQLQQAVGNVTQNSKRQNDSAYTVASSVQEMSASINDISQRSQQASTLVENAYSLSERGHEVVLNASKEMGNIAGKIAQSSDVVQALGKQSQEISSIVNVIKGIADQTNLLALNASIEAARAGEQGRGFAVVADEVRKLAERTAQSTDEIAKMVEGIQSGTMNAVQSMESVNSSIESGVNLASQAAGSIEEIKDSSRGISTVVSEISHALKEQREANSSIANSIEQIAHMSEQNMNTVQETASSAHRLENLAKNLRTSVSHFQV